jgi:hypothetical protein
MKLFLVGRRAMPIGSAALGAAGCLGYFAHEKWLDYKFEKLLEMQQSPRPSLHSPELPQAGGASLPIKPKPKVRSWLKFQKIIFYYYRETKYSLL